MIFFVLIDELFMSLRNEDNKGIYVFQKMLCSLCGTTLSRTEYFELNACPNKRVSLGGGFYG